MIRFFLSLYIVSSLALILNVRTRKYTCYKTEGTVLVMDVQNSIGSYEASMKCNFIGAREARKLSDLAPTALSGNIGGVHTRKLSQLNVGANRDCVEGHTRLGGWLPKLIDTSFLPFLVVGRLNHLCIADISAKRNVNGRNETKLVACRPVVRAGKMPIGQVSNLENS